MITPTITHATPLLLRSHLSVDPVLTPNAFQLASFLSRAGELFLKLPLETVLRRGQVAVLQDEVILTRASGQWMGDLETIVRVGEYRGVVGTMWMIVREEGVTKITTTQVTGKRTKGKQTTHKGQGLQGLWRGWRVGMWGLFGMWSARALNGNGGNAGEF
jgi:fusion and transport protein UGO1